MRNSLPRSSRRAIEGIVVSVLLLIGCVTNLSEAAGESRAKAIFRQPPETGDGWSTSDIESVGLNPEPIQNLMADIRSSRIENIYAVIIAKNGKLVVDEYFNGANRAHIGVIASITKSLTSLLVGVALERYGGGTDVDTPLRDFFPDRREQFGGEGKAAITLRHALTMTAGLDWDEATYPHPDERNPNTLMYGAPDPVGFILARKVERPPGTYWNYNGGLSVLLGEVVRNLSGQYVDRFAATYLFGPLGFTRYQWERHPDGTVWAQGDLAVRPRDLAKLGQLVLDGGAWRGRRIVSEDWIKVSTRVHTRAGHGYQYGYQWWRGTAYRGSQELEVIFGSGTGGQKLFILPDLDLVMVVLSKVHDNPGGQERATFALTDYVLPAATPAGGRLPVHLDPMVAPAAVGKYRSVIDGQEIRVRLEEGKLYISPTFFSRIELTPVSRMTFRGRWKPVGDIRIEFIEDNAGAIDSADIHYLLGTRRFEKER